MTRRDQRTGSDAELGEQIARTLLDRHGAILGGRELRQALGFRTSSAFRQAVARGQLPVAVFEIPGRRGKFALTEEIAKWLTQRRASAREAAELPPIEQTQKGRTMP